MNVFDSDTFCTAVHKALIDQLKADGVPIGKYFEIIAAVASALGTVGDQVGNSLEAVDRRAASTEALVADLEERLTALEASNAAGR